MSVVAAASFCCCGWIELSTEGKKWVKISHQPVAIMVDSTALTAIISPQRRATLTPFFL